MSKLFVGSLSWDTDSDSLRSAFEKFGEVTDSFVCKDRETQRSRGFGFITFADERAASKAKQEMDGAELDGRQIKVDSAADRSSAAGAMAGAMEDVLKVVMAVMVVATELPLVSYHVLFAFICLFILFPLFSSVQNCSVSDI
ncbi:hypothetical protein L0F63_001153, partial [Massospora cicadina]